MRKFGICVAALLCLTACPAEETNNGVETDMGSTNSNPAECPATPPAATESCTTDGVACTYALECPCGPREDFVWTCTGGQLAQPSLTCSTGAATSCPNAADMSLPDGGSVDMAASDVATTPDVGPDVPVDMARPRLEAHGCTYATATDQTGNAIVVITDLLAWDLGHTDFCIIVDAGTVVTWNGEFTAHPLDGGVSPTENVNSPIDIAAQDASGVDTVDVTLITGGDYPYYCSIHTGIMRGVVYVD